ncbi:hypothetical protein [Paenibacillus polysaccharolyticus]|uniref:hypothetical protein n=1 Tax=Paenibacillus polysaccharolyticus TaxID=582692 RepID=UPI001113768C|nr:hypothetical protein [Paenibacillus polysaccharolyticus]
MLSLLAPELPQTSTFVPFESNVRSGMQKRSGQKEPGETKCSHLQPDFTLEEGTVKKSGSKGRSQGFLHAEWLSIPHHQRFMLLNKPMMIEMSLEPTLPQTSTFVPFESNVTRYMQKRIVQKGPGETKCSHLQPDFTLEKGK